MQPQPTFTIILAMWVAWPVPTHIVTEVGGEWPDPTDLAFNGPFVVESYTPADNIVFARNDNYAGEHLAYLDRVTYKYIEDTGTAKCSQMGLSRRFSWAPVPSCSQSL